MRVIQFFIPVTLLCLFTVNVAAQNYSQKVINEKNEPVSFASIAIIGTSIGTISNAKGEFTLPSHFENSIVRISSIGYKSIELSYKNIQSISNILLHSEPRILKEVIIMPDSVLKEILKKSYLNITRNYPIRPFTITGYHSEVESSKDGKIVYAGESIMEVHQEGYHNENEVGQFRVLNSRVATNKKKDSLDNVWWQGGSFIAIENDVVKKRTDFLNYKNFNTKFHYELIEENYYDSDTVYVIKFESLKSKLKSGQIFIDKRSGAYIKLLWFEESKGTNRLELINRKSESNEINFKKIENLWVLSNINFGMEFQNKRSQQELQIKIIFVVTSTVFDTKSIPFEERNLSGVFANQELKNPDIFDSYPTYIDNYLPDSTQKSFRNIFIKTKSDEYVLDNEKSFKEKIVQNLIKLNFNFGLGGFNIPYSPTLLNQNSTLILDFNERYALNIYWGISYQINRYNALIYDTKKLILDKNIESMQRSIYYSRSIIVKKEGNSMFIEPMLGVFKIVESKNLGKIEGQNIQLANITSSLVNPTINYFNTSYQINVGLGIRKKFEKSSLTLRPEFGRSVYSQPNLNYKESVLNAQQFNLKIDKVKSVWNYAISVIINL